MFRLSISFCVYILLSLTNLFLSQLGETISPMKEDFIMVHLQHACTHCCILMVSGNRWVCKQCKNFQLCDKYESCLSHVIYHISKTFLIESCLLLVKVNKWHMVFLSSEKGTENKQARKKYSRVSVFLFNKNSFSVFWLINQRDF